MTIPLAEGLLAPSDIADLAGVSRAAVSNWRKRMADFPKPTGGTANKPLFLASEVAEWLSQHPEKSKATGSDSVAAREWESVLWGVANNLRAQTTVDRIGELIAVAAAASVRGLPIPENDDLPKALRDNLLAAIEAIPATDVARVVDSLLERTTRAQGKSAGMHGFVGSRTSNLLASLAANMRGGTLYDPFCGVGVALLKAVELGAQPDLLVGEDINETAIRITDARTSLRGIEIETRVVDTLLEDADPNLKANVIIAEPPISLAMTSDAALLDPRLQFGIPVRRNLDGFWPQHVISHLAEGGVGYVVTTPGFLLRGGADAEIRSNLLRSGWVNAVVSLPGKMLPNTSIPLALLVLKKTDTEEVLLIDGSESESPETLVSLWLSDPNALATVPHQFVSILDLIDGDSVLSPSRWIEIETVSTTTIQSTFSTARSQLNDAVSELTNVVAQMSQPGILSQHQVLTVAELIDAGALEMIVAKPASDHDSKDLKQRTVDAAAIRQREVPDVSGMALVEDAALTKPGDVLVSTMNDIQSFVDDIGGLLPVGSIYRLRILDKKALDSHYLADVVAGEWNLRFAAGSAIQRIPIRDIEVPVIPIQEQRAAHTAIADVRDAHELADAVSEAAANLSNTMLLALRHGIDVTKSSEGEAQ